MPCNRSDPPFDMLVQRTPPQALTMISKAIRPIQEAAVTRTPAPGRITLQLPIDPIDQVAGREPARVGPDPRSGPAALGYHLNANRCRPGRDGQARLPALGGLPSAEHNRFDRLQRRRERHSLIHIERRLAGDDRLLVQSARQSME